MTLCSSCLTRMCWMSLAFLWKRCHAMYWHSHCTETEAAGFPRRAAKPLKTLPCPNERFLCGNKSQTKVSTSRVRMGALAFVMETGPLSVCTAATQWHLSVSCPLCELSWYKQGIIPALETTGSLCVWQCSSVPAAVIKWCMCVNTYKKIVVVEGKTMSCVYFRNICSGDKS